MDIGVLTFLLCLIHSQILFKSYKHKIVISVANTFNVNNYIIDHGYFSNIPKHTYPRFMIQFAISVTSNRAVCKSSMTLVNRNTDKGISVKEYKVNSLAYTNACK